VFGAARYYEEFTSAHVQAAMAKVDAQVPFDDQKSLIGVQV
jgi:hypothetical protein